MANLQPQPAARSGEILAEKGRWTEAAARRVLRLRTLDVQWPSGPLGNTIFANGVVLGRIKKPMHNEPGRPWIIRIEGYEAWTAPSPIMPRWHYSPVWSAPTLQAAQEAVMEVLRSVPVGH